MPKRASESSVSAPKRVTTHTDEIIPIVLPPAGMASTGLYWSILFSNTITESIQRQLSTALRIELFLSSHWSLDGSCLCFPPRNATKVLCVIYDVMDVSCPDTKILKFERPKVKRTNKKSM